MSVSWYVSISRRQSALFVYSPTTFSPHLCFGMIRNPSQRQWVFQCIPCVDTGLWVSLGTSIRHTAGTSQEGSRSQERLAAATPSQCHALPVQNCGLESPSETSSGYSIPFPQQEAARAAAKQTEITPSARHRAGEGAGAGAVGQEQN